MIIPIQKNLPLPKCSDREYHYVSNGIGGVLAVKIPSCPLTTIHPGNMNCRHILEKGKCPHKYNWKPTPTPMPVVSTEPHPFQKQILQETENDKKKDKDDLELLNYLDEIDPLD